MSRGLEQTIDDAVHKVVRKGAISFSLITCVALVVAMLISQYLRSRGHSQFVLWPYYTAFLLFFVAEIVGSIALAIDSEPELRGLLRAWGVNWQVLTQRTIRQSSTLWSHVSIPLGLALLFIWTITIAPFPVMQVGYFLVLYYWLMRTVLNPLDKVFNQDFPTWVMIITIVMIFFLPLYIAETLAATTERGPIRYLLAAIFIMGSAFVYFELISRLCRFLSVRASVALFRLSGAARRLTRRNDRKSRFVGIAQYLFLRHLVFQLTTILILSPMFFAASTVVDPRWVVTWYTAGAFGFPFFTVAYLARNEPRNVYHDIIRHSLPFGALFIVSLNFLLYFIGFAANMYVRLIDRIGLTEGQAVFPDFMIAFARYDVGIVPIWTMIEATLLAAAFATSIAWVYSLVLRRNYLQLARGLLLVASLLFLPMLLTENMVVEHFIRKEWLTPRIFLVTAIPALFGGIINLLADRIGEVIACTKCGQSDHYNHAIYCHHCGARLADQTNTASDGMSTQLDFLDKLD